MPCCARRTVFRALLFALLLCACAATAQAQGALGFALLGDTPYSQAQANLLDDLIDRINAEPLAFAAHVGDITDGAGPCTDEWLRARKRQFERFRHPFVLLPGDNEWTDCHRGGFDPLERLARWRQLFCAPVALPGFRRAGSHCENVRWETDEAVFVGLNVPGSNNNFGRTEHMNREHAERMREVFVWLDEAERTTRTEQMLIVLMQADPFLRPRRGGDGFSALRERLAKLARARPGRLVLVHGDTHFHRDDEPLPGLRRIVVPGAPAVDWLRASFSRGKLNVERAGPP